MLTLIKVLEKTDKNRKRIGLYQCDCEEKTIKELIITAVENDYIKSCGCLTKKRNKERFSTHGMSSSREYGCWTDMKKRCLNPKNTHYNNYGGRGITVCQLWLYSFEDFYRDMGPKPSEEYTLDRIDVYGNYCPNNCRWANQKTQANNRTNNVNITCDGKSQTLKQWCDESTLDYDFLRGRLRDGWNMREALSKPKRKLDRSLYTINGESKSLIEWSKQYNKSYQMVQYRMSQGWSLEESLTKEKTKGRYTVKPRGIKNVTR